MAGERDGTGRDAETRGRDNRGKEGDQLAEEDDPQFFTTEPGAEGLPQLVIPGAEKASVATQTQRLADAKLKPKVAQKGLEIGLFGDDSKQGSLFEDDPEFAAKVPKSEAFKKWFGESKVVDENGDPLVVYHGTTADFDSFNKGRANPESDFGAGFYFSNTKADVGSNYSGLGPDLTNKIEREAERIAGETDREYNDPDVVAEARTKFMDHEGATVPVYLAIKNPFVLGGENETYLDLNVPETDDDGELIDEYAEPTGPLIDFVTALRSVAAQYDEGSVDGVVDSLLENYDGLSAEQVMEITRADEQFGYYQDENGDLANHEIVRETLERIGFDGVIDNSVDKKFGSQRRAGQKMKGMDENTVHYIAFSPTQIKSIFNRGNFDPNDPAILAEDEAEFKAPAFQKWFGNSQVVDANGKPLVVHHGAPDARFVKESGIFQTALQRHSGSDKGGVFWFAKDRRAAVTYADDRRAFDYQNAEPAVIDAYLSLQNPLVIDAKGKDWREAQMRGKSSDVIEQAQAEGHDGVIIHNVRDDYMSYGKPTWRQRTTTTYAVFNSRQIKSVKNRGTYDPDDPSILNEDEAEFPTPRRRQSGTRGMPASRPGPASFIEPDDSTMSVLMNQNLPMLGRVGGAISNATLSIRRGVQDKMADWKRVERAMIEQTGVLPQSMQVYRTETLFHGRTGERLEDLRMDTIEPLIQKMADLKVTQADLDKYLYARHAPERNEYIASINPDMPDGGSGMTNAEAAAVIRDMQRRGVLANVKTIAAKIDIMLRDNRERLFNNGIIDQETFDSWSNDYENYVPLRGFEIDPEEDARLGQGKRYDSRTKVVLEALGRKSKADSPLAYIIAQAQQSIILAEKARVGRSVLRLARQYPNPNLWEVDQVVSKRVLDPTTGLVSTRIDNTARVRAENVLAVREGGKLYWVTLHHQGLLAGIKGTEASSMNAVLRMGTTINRYLALMRTGLDPQFFIPNFLRDLETAGIHIAADQGKTILKNVLRDLPKALAGSFKGERGNLNSAWAQHYREFAQAGGKVGVFGLEDIGTIKNRISRDLSWAEGGTAVSALKAAAAVKDFVMDINGAIESGVRLSLFVNMRRAGYSVDDAAFAAKEATVNFNRKGEWGNWINATFLFFNASVQGTARIAQALARSKLVRRAAFGMFLSGILMDIINSMIAGDSDDDGENDYDQIKDHIKERNLIFMWPGSKSGEEIHIPLPWVYNVFFFSGNNVGRIIRGKAKPIEATANIMGAIAQAANPLYSNSWVQMVTPTILDVGLDLYMNEDWKGDPIMPGDNPFGVQTPDSQKAFETVTPWSREIAETLNSLTGGDTVRPGTIDVSPESIDYIANFIGGGVASTVNQVGTTVGALVRGDEIVPERIPFVRKVYGKHVSSTGRSEYYEMRDAIELTAAQIESAKDAKDRAKMMEIRKEFPADVRVLPLLKETDKLLTKLRKQRNAATSDEAKQKIRERMDLIMSRFRKKYRSLQEKLQ